MQREVVVPTSLTSIMPHYNVQQKCISILKHWYFTLLPGISLTALICLVDALELLDMPVGGDLFGGKWKQIQEAETLQRKNEALRWKEKEEADKARKAQAGKNKHPNKGKGGQNQSFPASRKNTENSTNQSQSGETREADNREHPKGARRRPEALGKEQAPSGATRAEEEGRPWGGGGGHSQQE